MKADWKQFCITPINQDQIEQKLKQASVYFLHRWKSNGIKTNVKDKVEKKITNHDLEYNVAKFEHFVAKCIKSSWM